MNPRYGVLLITGSHTHQENYAAAFAAGCLEIVRDAGHLPQIEQPASTFALIDRYVSDRADRRSRLSTSHSMSAV